MNAQIVMKATIVMVKVSRTHVENVIPDLFVYQRQVCQIQQTIQPVKNVQLVAIVQQAHLNWNHVKVELIQNHSGKEAQ